jgi:flagellar hook assembly protein FlgD
MTHDDYMLILGSNIYADQAYMVSYQIDKETGDRTHLFTLENSDGNLTLTTEIRDENSELIAKIDRNELTQINKNFDVQGEIEKGNGLTLTKRENGDVIFNAKITEDGYVAVSGIFYIGRKKIRITDRTVEINDTPKQTINGVNVHDTFFVGNYDITLTDDGLRF